MSSTHFTVFLFSLFFFFQAEDGIRDVAVTGVQTCALPILAAYAASVMCSVCDTAAALVIAAIGSTFTACPLTSSNPVGAFIQAFAITTKTPDATPLTATAIPAHRCARAEMRSHPYR